MHKRPRNLSTRKHQKRKRASLLCLVFVLTCPPSPSSAQDISEIDLAGLLDAEIVTTKTDSSFSEAPAVLTIIDRDDLRWWQYQTVSDALQHVIGFYFVDDHINPNAGVRGIAGSPFGDSGSIKVMINGMSVAFRPTSGNWTGLELIPMSAIERIEIIRGPASALYGADAFLGVVNIITRTPDTGLHADLNTSHGLSEHAAYQWSSNATLTWGSDHWTALLAASGGQTDRSGLRLPDSSPAPKLSTPDDTTATDLLLESASAFSQITFSPSEHHTTTLSSRLAYWKRNAEFAPWLQLTSGHSPDLQPTTFQQLQFASWLRHQSDLSEQFQIRALLGFSMGRPLAGDQIEVGSDLFFIQRDFSHNTLDANTEIDWRPLPSLQFIVGGEASFDQEQLPSNLCIAKSNNASTNAGQTIENCSQRQGSVAFTNIGAYLQTRWAAIDDYLSFSGGLRFDWNSIYSSQLSGLAAIVSNPIEPLVLKILYGSAFKAPAPLLLYAKPLQTNDIIGNDQLKPQFIHTVSGVASYQFDTHIFVSGIVAYNYLENKAEFVQQGVNQLAKNIAQSETLNFELETKARWQYLSGYLGLEYVHAVRETNERGYRDALFGSQNVIYPSYNAKLGLTAPLSLIRLSAEGILSAPTRSGDANTLEAGQNYTLPLTFCLNANIASENLRLFNDLPTTIALTMNNLFLSGSAAPGQFGIDYPLPPTTWMLTLGQEL